MNDELPTNGTAFFAELYQRAEAKQETYKAVVESPAYQRQLSRLEHITLDFINTLRLCLLAATRTGDWVNKSLFMRSIDDLNSSAIMVRTAIHEGARNSARRELRYMVELAIKALYVEQKMPLSSFDDRLVFFDRKLDPASIAPVNDLKFTILSGPDGKKAGQKLLAAYARACEYVHPSVRQIEERLQLSKKGISPGFETAEELSQSNDEAFEVFALILVLLFEAIGGSFSGDVWETGGLSDQDGWIFHGHPLVAALDEHFDYKAERQERLAVIKERRAKRLTEANAFDWPVLKDRSKGHPS